MLVDNRDRGEQARLRLGVTPEMMKGVPLITPLLKHVGGIDECLDALRGDDSPDALAFVEKWDSISKSDLDRVSVEEICVAAGLTTRRLVEVITGALMQQARDATKLIVAAAQPGIVAKTAKMALTDFGNQDRDTFHKATGFLPQPKGTSINLNQLNQSGLPAPGDKEEKALPPPSADNWLLEIQSVIRPDLKLIEAPLPDVIANVPDLESEYVMDGDDVL